MAAKALIKTDKKIDPQTIINSPVLQKEDVLVASAEFPKVFIAPSTNLLAGVRIEEAEGGYAVSTGLMATRTDIRIFALTIDVIVVQTGGTAYDGETPLATSAEEHYNAAWMDESQKADLQEVKSRLAKGEDAVVANGVIVPICINAQLLNYLHINVYGEYRQDDMDRLQSHLCGVQCMLNGKKPTEVLNMVILPEGEEMPMTEPDPEDVVHLATIAIQKGKVSLFNYIAAAEALYVVDQDTKDSPAVTIHRRDMLKVLPGDIFRPLDACHILRSKPLSVKLLREIMDHARPLSTNNLAPTVTMPGTGDDPDQNTIILMWNPGISSSKMADHNASIPRMLWAEYNWSVWEHDKARMGDKFYLVRCGEGRTGIAMSGVFTSHPYEAGDWSGRGRQTFYMEMLPNVILNPEVAPMVSTDELRAAIPDFEWGGGHSGRLLSREDSKKLEALWAKFIVEHRKDVDRKTLNMWG